PSTHPLSLHDALPICLLQAGTAGRVHSQGATCCNSDLHHGNALLVKKVEMWHTLEYSRAIWPCQRMKFVRLHGPRQGTRGPAGPDRKSTRLKLQSREK